MWLSNDLNCCKKKWGLKQKSAVGGAACAVTALPFNTSTHDGSFGLYALPTYLLPLEFFFEDYPDFNRQWFWPFIGSVADRK